MMENYNVINWPQSWHLHNSTACAGWFCKNQLLTSGELQEEVWSTRRPLGAPTQCFPYIHSEHCC